MAPDSRHQRIAELFAAANALPPEQRAAFLEAECAADDALRGEVEELLGLARGEDAFLDDGPGTTLRRRAERSLLDAVDDAPMPAMIGDYRIIGVVGRGGMGVVYEAEQQKPKRRVALKVLRASMRDPDAQRRFELEAEILGRLQHPGIASVLEAGVADIPGHGPQPFLAMELVRGTTLSQWARDRRLTTRQKIEMLAQACDAVQHAHERGVIHRDLKPGNILVGEDGRPRVVDFGIARVTDPALAPAAHSVTQTGGMLGTLAYMAPEQARGRSRDIDARTDCWALGAVGWELISGRPPHDVTGLSLPEAARRISEEEVPRLSSVNRSLRGDLETVLGKALERDPARRYASVSELAADLRRWLADEPILARPPSAWYQLRKFSRRHWGLVTGACVAVLALLIGLAAATWQAGVARERAAEAEAAREDAEAARGDAERLAYRASLAAAVAALEGHNFLAARRSLADAPEALRGWEWAVLASRLDGSAATADLEPDDRALRIADVEPDGRTLDLFVDGADVVLRWDAAARALGDPPRVDAGLARPVRLPEAMLPHAAMFIGLNRGEAAVDVQDLGGRPLSRIQRPGPPDGAISRPIPMRDGTILLRAQDELHPADGLLRGDPRTGEVRWTAPAFGLDTLPAVVPGEKRIVVVHNSTSAIQVLDAASGRVLRESPGLGDDVISLAVSADGTALLMGSANSGKVRLVDLGDLTVRAVRAIERAGAIHVIFAADDTLAITSGAEGSLVAWSADLERRIDVFPGHEAPMASIRELSALGLVATTDLSGGLRLWRASDLARPAGILGPFGSYLYHAAWSRDGERIVACTFDGRLQPVNVSTGERLGTPIRPALPPGAAAMSVLVEPAGTLLLSSSDGSVLRLDGTTFEPLARLDGCGGKLAPSPDGERILAASDDGTCLIGRATLTGRLTDIGPADVAAWSPDGRHVATAAADGSVSLRDATTLRILHVMPAASPVRSLAWSPDGSVLAIGREKRMAEVASPDGRVLATFPSEGRVLSLTFSPDGGRLLMGGDGGLLHVVDTARWEDLVAIPGHDAYIYSASWAPDGQRLATASGDGTARIWSPVGLR